MPWISIHVSRPVSQATQEEIRRALGQVLLEEMQKEERGLFIDFLHPLGLYRAGVPGDDAAALELRYIGRFGLPEKQRVTRRISQVLSGHLALDPQKIIVVFQEVESENWGRRQGDYN
jgi:phenylpyruvate tautomerase PptA (4-oxalocrotonate tautomerase family)